MAEKKKKIQHKRPDVVTELENLRNKLTQYYVYRNKVIIKEENLTDEESASAIRLNKELGLSAGRFGDLIYELTGLNKISRKDETYEIWYAALSLMANPIVVSALDMCISAVTKAIGKLEDNIKQGIRDKHGKKLTSFRPLKVFIAHEGETEQLRKLKDFLEALGIKYFIAESKASDGRSIERQVNWTQSEADFAICLATKGKAVNKKTGKHYMAPNIIDELGRARQVFGNKIILLVQKGVEVHTNIREIVHETFTTTNMERAFIKIAKELTNWGFITAGTIKEQT